MLTSKRTRRINVSRIMRCIWLNKGFSRTEIANSLGLDKSTVSNIISDLIDINAIYEIAEGEAGPQGGRKPIKLTINKDFCCVMGIELRPDSYSSIVVNLDGAVLFSKSGRIKFSPDNLISLFLDIVAKIKADIEKTGIPLLGIGVGLSGIINPKLGIIEYSIPLNIYKDFDFLGKVVRKIDVPVIIGNDANCCSWGELTFHKAKNLKNFLFILIEFRNSDNNDFPNIAVGMGFVLNGKVHYGETFSAGEFRSILWKQSNSGQFSLTNEQAYCVESNTKVFKIFAKELCAHIALFVNSLNLNHVFLGGDIEKYSNSFLDILKNEIKKNWSYPNDVDCSIRFSTLKDSAVAYGAAGMLLSRLFADPEFSDDIREIDLLHTLITKAKFLVKEKK